MTAEEAEIAANFLAHLANLPDNATFGSPVSQASQRAEEAADLNEAGDAIEATEAQEEDDDWVYGENKKHQSYMVHFMRFKDGVNYAKNHRFEKEDLLAIRPMHVRRWLNQLAYHTPTPGPDDRPLYYRSGSLKKAKGGISFFHPNKHSPWIDPHGGNPTQHRSINELIQKVAKAEVRGLGRKANDKRPYTREEFQTKMDLFRQRRQDFNHNVKYPMITLW